MSILTKAQLKKIAKMHAASVIMSTESAWAFESSNISIEEIEYLDNEFRKIAFRLLEGEVPMFTANEIVNYIRNQK